MWFVFAKIEDMKKKSTDRTFKSQNDPKRRKKFHTNNSGSLRVLNGFMDFYLKCIYEKWRRLEGKNKMNKMMRIKGQFFLSFSSSVHYDRTSSGVFSLQWLQGRKNNNNQTISHTTSGCQKIIGRSHHKDKTQEA